MAGVVAKAADLLSARDRTRLVGVHPDLVAVVEAARHQMPFIVVEGLRTRDRQVQLVKSGASRTMDSRHLTGHAVDLAPTVEGEVRWDWPLF
jgi:peptidoglycan L-alanyl-D-glutamate endopeptidase CwlK